MNSQKRNTRNLNLKEENRSRFIFRELQRTVVKKFVQWRSSSPSLFFFFFFFCLSLSNVFFLYHSLPPCALTSVRRKGSPSSSWRWRRRFYHRPVDVYLISLIAMAGWAIPCGVRLCLNLSENLSWTPKISRLDFLI